MQKKHAEVSKSKLKIEILKIEEFRDHIRNQRQEFSHSTRSSFRSTREGKITSKTSI